MNAIDNNNNNLNRYDYDVKNGNFIGNLSIIIK